MASNIDALKKKLSERVAWPSNEKEMRQAWLQGKSQSAPSGYIDTTSDIKEPYTYFMKPEDINIYGQALTSHNLFSGELKPNMVMQDQIDYPTVAYNLPSDERWGRPAVNLNAIEKGDPRFTLGKDWNDIRDEYAQTPELNNPEFLQHITELVDAHERGHFDTTKWDKEKITDLPNYYKDLDFIQNPEDKLKYMLDPNYQRIMTREIPAMNAESRMQYNILKELEKRKAK